MGHSRSLFLYIRLFNKVDRRKVRQSLAMTGFELLTTGVRSNCSTNGSTTTAKD